MYYYREKDYWYFGALEKSVYKNLKLISSFKRNATNKEIYIKSDPAKDFLLKEFVSDNEIEEADPLSMVRDGCKAEIEPYKELLSRKDIELLIDNLPLLKKPRSYQMDYLYYAINHGNHVNGSSVGTGKAQPLGTTIWTPKGAKKMGDLKIGDKILGVNSGIQTVTGIFPQGKKKCYKVTFTDGSFTKCCEDHLWNVCLEKGGQRILSLKEIKEKGLRRLPKNGFYGTGQHKSYGLWRFALPIIEKPIEFDSKEVLIDPYTLGVLLGDGCFAGSFISISNPEIDIINGLVLPKGMKKSFKKQRSKAIEVCLSGTTYHCNPIKNALKKYNLYGKHSYEKFIPEDYLVNDAQVRLEILRGLMDTDGAVGKHGAVSFEVTSLQLVKDVKFLATSLGCKCYNIRTKKSYIGKVRHRDCYRLTISAPKDLNIFKNCKQKIERSSLKERRYLTRRFFKEIEYIGEEEMQCISVSNENNLYLCDNFIPTHNTISTIFYAEMLDLFPCMVVCPASVKSGWLREWKETNPNRRVSVISTTSPAEDFDADVLVINYDILGRRTEKNGKTSIDIRLDGMKKKTFSLIIADEIHFLKNRKSIRSKTFKKLTGKSSAIIGLTGTLIMNRPSELLNILALIGRLKEIAPDDPYHHYFFERYCNMKETFFGMDVTGASNIKELNDLLIKCCYFHVSKRDALKELPPVTENMVECEITNKKTYKAAEEDLLEFIFNHFKDEEKVEKAARAEFLVKMNLLKQLSLEGKVKAIKKWIEEWLEANEDDKLLVFGSHSTILKDIQKLFKNSLLVIGETTGKKREKVLSDFATDPSKRLLFANMGCLGTGVDGLQKVCSNMAILELPSRPSDLVQVIGRLERSGQENPVTIQYLLSSSTIDKDLWEMLKNKKSVTDMLNKGFEDDSSLMILKNYGEKAKKRKGS
jgi:superfamily II DNA or RNA helicase